MSSFLLNRYWTFEKKHPMEIKEVVLYYLVIGSGIFINIGVTQLVISIHPVPIVIAALFAAVATSVWGYLMAKHLIFKVKS